MRDILYWRWVRRVRGSGRWGSWRWRLAGSCAPDQTAPWGPSCSSTGPNRACPRTWTAGPMVGPTWKETNEVPVVGPGYECCPLCHLEKNIFRLVIHIHHISSLHFNDKWKHYKDKKNLQRHQQQRFIGTETQTKWKYTTKCFEKAWCGVILTIFFCRFIVSEYAYKSESAGKSRLFFKKRRTKWPPPIFAREKDYK